MAAPMNLGASNFYLSGNNRNILSISVPGIVCVMIKMNQCDGSAAVQPIFYTLSGEERSIQYGILNITEQPAVVAMSRASNLPIAVTPIIALFVNHIAYAKFSGKKKNLVSLRSWLRKMISEVRQVQQHPGQFQQSSFVQQPQPSHGYPQQGHPSARGGFPGAGRGGPQMPAGRQPAFQSQLSAVDDDDDQQLKMPDSVTPHNTPWEAGIKMAHEY